MPPPYPPSSWEAAIGSFLSAYSQMKGLKMQQRESDLHAQEARDTSNLRKATLADQGYVSQDMTVPDTTDRNWLQGVGHALFGSQPEHREALLKIGPSAAERAASTERDFVTGRDTARYQNERGIEELKTATDAMLERRREAAADSRNNADNTTRLQVAAVEKDVQRAALDAKERDAFFDQALQAADGDPVRAMSNVERYQMPQAQRFRASRADYYAARARFRDRRAALTREGYESRSEIAAKRGNTVQAHLRAQLRPDLYGAEAPGGDPQADQRAMWDAAAARTKGADPVKLLGPRP